MTAAPEILIDPPPVVEAVPVMAAQTPHVPDAPDVAADAVRASLIERHPLWFLALITLLGGALRFFALDRPAIWGDEAMTFGRVVGTYQDLLDQLITDGFGPLHYSFYWWLNSDYHLPAEMLRWVRLPLVAVCIFASVAIGLSRTADPHRRTRALLIASAVGALAGAIAFFLVDFWITRAYQPWLDAGTPLTPLLMRLLPAVCGTAMIPAMYFLCRQFFGAKTALVTALFTATSAYMLVYSRDAKMYADFWLACVLFIACLLWWLRSRARGAYFCWLASGVAMVGLHKLGLIVFFLSAVFFLLAPRQHWTHFWRLPWVAVRAVAWPFVWVWYVDRFRTGTATLERRDARFRFLGRINAAFRWPPVIFYALGMTLIWSTLYGPWGYYKQFNVSEEITTTADGQFDPNTGGVSWVQSYNATRTGPEMALMTTTAFLYSWEWPRTVPAESSADARTKARLDDQRQVDEKTLRLLKGAGAFLLCLLATATLPWRKVFAGRRVLETALPDVENVYAPYRRLRVLWLAVWIFMPVYGVYLTSFRDASTPWDMLSTALTRAPVEVTWPKAETIFTKPLSKELSAGDVAAGGQAGQDSLWREHPWAWGKIVAGVVYDAGLIYGSRIGTWSSGLTVSNLYWPAVLPALSIGAGLVTLTCWRPRIMLRSSAQVLLAGAGVFVIGCILHLAIKPGPGSVWMPRYVGVVWPPVAIVVAALLLRLPTRPVRALAVGALVAVNLANFSARVLAASEPPTARLVDDLYDGRDPNGPFRAYFGDIRRPGIASMSPGGGLIFTAPARYYLALRSNVPAVPDQIRRGGYEQRVGVRAREVGRTEDVQRDLQRSPNVRRFVIWTAFEGKFDQTDNVGRALEGQFRRTSDEFIPVRDHWRWMDLYTLRRRTYERIEVGKF